MAFSAEHLLALTECLFNQLPNPPDLVKISRLQNPVSGDLTSHLIDFIENVNGAAKEIPTFVVETIASSFLFDHYPPDMHGKWR